jgi:hypothetical protein
MSTDPHPPHHPEEPPMNPTDPRVLRDRLYYLALTALVVKSLLGLSAATLLGLRPAQVVFAAADNPVAVLATASFTILVLAFAHHRGPTKHRVAGALVAGLLLSVGDYCLFAAIGIAGDLSTALDVLATVLAFLPVVAACAAIYAQRLTPGTTPA